MVEKKITVKKNRKKEATKSKQEKKLITKTMLIGDVAMKFPKAVPVMFKHGMHCIGCGMTAYETIEQGCMAHGMSAEEIDKMIEEMNKEVAE